MAKMRYSEMPRDVSCDSLAALRITEVSFSCLWYLLPVLNSVYTFQGILGDEGIASCIYNLDIRFKQVNRFTPLPLYSLRKRPKQPLNGRLGGPHYGFSENACEHFDCGRLEQTSIGVAIKQPIIVRNRIGEEDV